MKHNLLKFNRCVEQSYSHIPSKEWTLQLYLIQCDVILGDVILRTLFAQCKSEKLKHKLWSISLYWEWLSRLKQSVQRYVIGMDVILYKLYSLDDWTVGLANRTSFVQEVVLQEHLFDICYNSSEKNMFWFWKMRSLYVTQWINVTMKSIQRKYFFYKQAALAQ